MPESDPFPAQITATLSPQASDLVRWYSGVTKHREEATVEGAVFGMLDRAKDAYAEDSRHDEAFDWLLEDVLTGMSDFARQVGHRRFRPSFRLSVSAAELLRLWCQECGHDPRDLINGALVCTFTGVDNPRRTLAECIADAKSERMLEEGEWTSRHGKETTAQ